VKRSIIDAAFDKYASEIPPNDEAAVQNRDAARVEIVKKSNTYYLQVWNERGLVPHEEERFDPRELMAGSEK